MELDVPDETGIRDTPSPLAFASTLPTHTPNPTKPPPTPTLPPQKRIKHPHQPPNLALPSRFLAITHHAPLHYDRLSQMAHLTLRQPAPIA